VAITPLTKVTAQNIICQISFSKRMVPNFDTANDLPFLHWVERILDWLEKGRIVDEIPLLALLPYWGKHWNTYCDDVNQIRIEITKILEEHKKSEELPNDLMSTILNVSQEEQQIAEQDIITIMGDLFVAGTDTTSNTINWAIALLHNHPEVEAKLVEEIRIMGGSGTPSAKSFEEMPYLNAGRKLHIYKF
jgi:cytochrome P450 family 2 subfamily U polypeptide 1